MNDQGLFADLPEEENPDFDWSDHSSIAIYEQPRTAIYFSPRGALVIRQQAWCGRCDEDHFVYFEPHNIDDLLGAIAVLRKGTAIG